MELASTKIVVLTLLGVIRLFFGLVPLKITKRLQLWGQEQGISHVLVQQRRAQVDLAISLCLCFGGGVLLATCFIHMIPEVRESIEAVKQSERSLLPPDSSFPYAELLICIGFFLVYIIEEVAHKIFLHHGSRPKSSTTQQCCSTVESEMGRAEEDSDKRTFSSDAENNVVSSWSRPKSSSKIVPATSQVHLLASTLSLEQKEVKPAKITTVQSMSKASAHHNHHHHYHHHHHGSFPMEDTDEQSVMGHLRSILVVLALSFHSVFEGLAIGLQQTERDVWYLFTAVSIHACAILFCVGLELVMSGMKLINLVVYVVVLAVMSPLGVVLGILATVHAPTDSAVQTLVVAVLQGLAGGTILYITFFEVLGREKKRDTGSGTLRIAFILVGFAVMVALQAVGGHDHGKGQGHKILPPNATLEDVHQHEHGS